MKADLHVHTTASDGRLSPGKIIEMAASHGVEVIAITDHDTIAGIQEAIDTARSTTPHVTVIPGIEINTDVPHGEVHILGYFIDMSDAVLLSTLERLRTSREKRGDAMVEKLHTLGMDIDWKRVRELANGGSIGRPHVAEALLEKGYVTSIKEAFDRYIGREGPAYVEREKVTPEDAIRLVLRARGIPVLAHPGEMRDLDDSLPSLIAAGLTGLEVWYGNYSPERVETIRKKAVKNNLITTGGSDFHGFSVDERQIGTLDVPAEAVQTLLKMGDKLVRRK